MTTEPFGRWTVSLADTNAPWLVSLQGQADMAQWQTSDSDVVSIRPAGELVARGSGIALVTGRTSVERVTVPVRITDAASTAVRVVAHRGFADSYPENTTVALDSAFAHDADAVEFDVWLTRDLVPVVMHDSTVDRTTDGSGRVNEMPFAAWGALNACARRPGYAFCTAPTLSEMLRAANGRGVVIHLNGPGWTEDATRDAITRVRAAGARRRAMFASFLSSDLLNLRAAGWSGPVILLQRNHAPFAAPSWLASFRRGGPALTLISVASARDSASALSVYRESLGQRDIVLGGYVTKTCDDVQFLRTRGVRVIASDFAATMAGCLRR